MKQIQHILLLAVMAIAAPAAAQWNTSGSNIYYSSGNVGIGTSTPAQKLDISGSLQLSNNIFSGGYAQFTNTGFAIPNVRIGYDGTNPEAISVYGNSIYTPVLKIRDVAYALGTGKGVIDIEADHNYMYGADGSGAALKYKVSAFNTSMNPHWGMYMDMQDNTAGSQAPITTYYTKVQTVNNNAYGYYADAAIKAGGTGKAYAFYGNTGLNYFAGNTGIGTTTPDAKLHVAGSFKLVNGSEGAGKVLTSDANGVATWQAATGGNSVWTDAGSGNIYTTTLAGKVGVGVAAVPTGFKMAVAGAIIAERVKVKLQGAWPDYVFNTGYTLPTLPEVERFIQQHSHLPGVPSAKEIGDNGIDLGDNQAILLKKIEELTLYVIDISKELTQIKAENTAIKKQLAAKQQ